ncbi:MAG: hypothetical protein ABSB81_07280 [Halobacteriota archaeon]|jgi:hypothetical protein
MRGGPRYPRTGHDQAERQETALKGSVRSVRVAITDHKNGGCHVNMGESVYEDATPTKARDLRKALVAFETL